MLCILCEYCDRGDLDSYIQNQKGNPISETRIKKFIIEILLAIEYMHHFNITHRDIKPRNIFLNTHNY